MSIQSIQKKIRLLGYSSIAKYFIEITHNSLLRLVYKFDKWHAISPYHSRIYKSMVVDIVNKNITELDTVIEIGCGLGDIISRIHADNRYGYDISNEVLKAAKFKNKKDINFYFGSILDIMANDFIKDITMLILVNWTHSIDGATIVNDIKKVHEIKPIKYILVDELYKTTSKHPVYHKYSEYFNNFAKEVDKQNDMESRHLVLYKVSNYSA